MLIKFGVPCTQLEEKIDTLERKVRRMGNTDPNLDPVSRNSGLRLERLCCKWFSQSLAEEVERLRRKLNEEGQDHLKQVPIQGCSLRSNCSLFLY